MINLFVSSEYESSDQAEVVWSKNQDSKKYPVRGVFDEGGKFWLAPSGHTGHSFTIKISNEKLTINRVLIKNHRFKSATSQRATRAFQVYGSLQENGQWTQLLKGEFKDPFPSGAPAPTVEVFNLKKAAEVKFLRFDIDSFWGVGGGLDYFAATVKPGFLKF